MRWRDERAAAGVGGGPPSPGSTGPAGRADAAARAADRARERARGRAEAEARDTGDDHEDHVTSGGWDSALFGRLLGYLRGHRALFLGSFVILLAVFALQLASPVIVRAAVDGPITAAVEAREAATAAGDPTPDLAPYRGELLRWTGLYLLLLLFGLAVRYLEVKQLARAGQAVIHDLRRELFGHMQGLHLGWFDRYPSGSLVTRVTSDIENLSEMFTAGIVQMAFDLSKIVVLFAVLFWLHPGLAAVVLAMMPLFLATSLFFRGGARRSSRRVRSRLSRLNGFLAESLLGMRVVQAFGREARVQGRFSALLERYFRANLKAIFFFAAFFASIGVVNAFTQGAMLRVGGPAIQDGSLTYGEFIQFWLYLTLLLDPIRELGERYNILQSAFASAERVFDILDTEPEVEDATAVPASLADGRSPRLALESVSFRYERGAEVLHDVSFAIEPGQTVAVVGATGAGKSTLVNLLLRFYDPTPGKDGSLGRVTMDGVDLRELDLAPWRERLGLVLQEDFLFAGTARENLTLGRAGAEAGLERALATASADRVVAGLPAGLDTHLGERGARLSTGQRELFAIARALAADPLFVILDEATASVDSATEAAIEEATGRLLAGRSAFVVAHRLSTIRRADRILVMHHGRLVEAGTHDELVARDGVYARLVTMQFHDA